MVKKILQIFILLISIHGCLNNKTIENDLLELKLNGKVKSIKEFSLTALDNFGVITKGVKLRETNFDFQKDFYITFNSNGKIIEKNLLDSNERPFEKSVFEYDNKNRITSKMLYNSEGNLHEKNQFKYSISGNLIEEIQYDSNTLVVCKFMNKYNDRNQNIETSRYLPDGKIDYVTHFQYNKKGHITEETHYDCDGKLEKKFENIFDENEKIIEEIHYNSDGNISMRTTYEYDNNGNVIQKTSQFDLFGINNVNKTTYKYDAKKMKVEECHYEPFGKLSYKLLFDYDEKGNEIEIKLYHTSGLISTRNYQYRYDKQKNWISRTVFINKIPKFIIEREITYWN